MLSDDELNKGIRTFIFSTCGTCGESTSIVEPCEVLGHNKFPETNFHGELTMDETKKMRLDLIQYLKDEKRFDEAKDIELNTVVREITFSKEL